MVAIDRMTKMALFIPTHTTVKAEGVADLLLENVICNHGFPDEIVSDRDTKFVNYAWSRLKQRLRLTQRYSHLTIQPVTAKSKELTELWFPYYDPCLGTTQKIGHAKSKRVNSPTITATIQPYK